MRKRYTNLNEEINRMKSLMTEERLYDNFVDYTIERLVEDFEELNIEENDTIGNYGIITEQRKGLSGAYWDDIISPIWRALIKSGDEVVILGRGKNQFRIKKQGDAGVQIWKNGVEIKNPSSLGELVDPNIRQMISRNIDDVSLDPELAKGFFNPKSINNWTNQVDNMLLNLQENNLITSSAREALLGEIRSLNIMAKMKHGFMPDGNVSNGILKTINSLEDFKKLYPKMYSYLEVIPGGASKYLKGISAASGKRLISDQFNSFTKVFNVLTDPIYKKTIKIPQITRRGDNITVTKLDTDTGLTTDFTFNLKEMADNERNLIRKALKDGESLTSTAFIDKMVRGAKEYNVSVTPKKTENALDDVENNFNFVENETILNIAHNNRKGLGSRTLFDGFINWNIKKYGDVFFQKYFMNTIKSAAFKTKLFKMNPGLQRLLEVIPFSARKAMDAPLLRSMGYMSGDGAGKVITNSHEKLLNAYWKTGKIADESGSIIVRGDDMVTLYGLPEGSIKSNLVKRSKEVRNSILSGKDGSITIDGKTVEALNTMFFWGKGVSPFTTLSKKSPTKLLRNASALLGGGGSIIYNMDNIIAAFWQIIFAVKYLIFEVGVEEFIKFLGEKIPVESRIAAARMVFIQKCLSVIQSKFSKDFNDPGKYNQFLSAVGCPSKTPLGEKEDPGMNNCLVWFDYDIQKDANGDINMEAPVKITKSVINSKVGEKITGIGEIVKSGGKIYLETVNGTAINLECGGECDEESEDINATWDSDDETTCGFEKFIAKTLKEFEDILDPDKRTENITKMMTEIQKSSGNYYDAIVSFFSQMMNISIDDIKDDIRNKKTNVEDKIKDIKDNIDQDSDVGDDIWGD